MKKLLFIAFTLIFISQLNAQTITINKASGWLESAFVEWQPVQGAGSYNVYYSGNGITNRKIDTQLIRNYATFVRADILGLAAGTYTIKVAPVVGGVEGTATETSALTVLAHDRTGFAFAGGRVPGAYKSDGTPKDGAIVIYITQNTKNTISMNITGANSNPCVGLQNILYGIKKGKDTRPFIIRLIGNITDMSVMEGGDITIENAQNASSYLTIEGVGNDAVVNGMGIRLKSATNVEIRNLASMNCNSTAGDDFGLQQDNDHIWLHNCDMFYGDAGSDADQIKGDGALDNKGSTYITFSYNHFWDNGKASLLGLSEGTTSGLYITYHHNWFDHSDSRHPRVRYYSAHVYNNYYDGNAKYGAGSTMGSSVFVEGNYFRNCKHPMMISMQGTDVWNETTKKNDPSNMGTFSSEEGGIIKAFNNTFDASTGTNNMRFVAYGDPNPNYNIAGVINSTTDFDAYVPSTRGEQVPATVKSYKGSNIYNNFDTDASLYVKNLTIDEPAVAKEKTIQYAGRTEGGDLKFSFNNSVDDASYAVNTTIKSALTSYTGSLVSIQGEIPVVESSQTLTTNTDNNQIVTYGTAIEPMIFTWGGSATDASVTVLPASGISFIKDASAKTITVSGTPTGSVTFTVTTSGSSGTPVSLSGSISIASTQTLVLTSSNNSDQTVVNGGAITPIVFTWGGDATDISVTGLPANGLAYNKDAVNKTITISGTPLTSTSYSITTIGAIGLPVSLTGTITVSTVDMVQNFTASGKTSSFYSITGNLSTGYGSVTYDGLTLTQCLKMESSTNITFTTTQAGVLTLVFNGAYTGSIKVDGVTSNITASTNVISVNLAAGSHTIIKGSGSTYLFYMKVVYGTTGTEASKSVKMNIYPNPVINTLIISTDNEIVKTDIFNASGLLIQSVTGKVNEISMSDFTKGTYIIRVHTKSDVFSQMIIKK